MNQLDKVSNVIIVLSGKGGVGKSTVAVQLACSLVNDGKKVGLLDLDICGPSIPHMLGMGNQSVHQSDLGWVPVYSSKDKNLAVMSIAFLLPSKDNAVIWRGPKKHSLISQFIGDVHWNELDYLIIDTPPGTSDEHMSAVQALKTIEAKNAILVTTPNMVSVGDVRREATFCQKVGLRVVGIVENMSGFICPNCQDCNEIFSSGGGKLLADETGLPLLGKIPIDPNLVKCVDEGRDFQKEFSNSPAATSFCAIKEKLIRGLEEPMACPIMESCKTERLFKVPVDEK